ncbi:MAG: NUDIX hydrolase [Acidimicrobiales bacterium]
MAPPEEGPPSPGAAVCRLVEGFVPETPREVGSRERFLAELGKLEDPFDRRANPVHVTGSGLVLGPRGTVLHVHRKLGSWLQPGGHVDPGEMPADAALRETAEETGLPVRHPEGGPRLVHLDVHPAADGHFHLDLRYLLVCEDAEPFPPAEESQQVKWFSLQEAVRVADDGLVDALARLQRLSAACGDDARPV